MGLSELAHGAARAGEMAQDNIEEVVDDVKGAAKAKVSPLKKKLTGYADTGRDIKNQLREAGGQIKDTLSIVKDKAAAYRVNFEKARTEEAFVKFLAKSESNLDWDNEADQWQIREHYVVFERATGVSEKLTGLYEGKLANVIGDSPELRTEISDHIMELSRSNPEQLLKLERYVAAVDKSEKQIQAKQAEIDALVGPAGKAAMLEKLDTLKLATSLKHRLIKKVRADKVGVGDEYALARMNAREDHGLETTADIKKEIKALKAGLKKVNSLEDAQTKIKTKFSHQRGEVFLDNETAKYIHEKMNGLIDQRIEALTATNKLSDLKKIKNTVKEVHTQFADEGKVKRTGFAKRILYDSGSGASEIAGKSTSELSAVEAELNEVMEKRITDKFTKMVARVQPDQLDAEVARYFGRAEFAGFSVKESEKRVWNAFDTVKDALPDNDPKKTKLQWILNKLKHKTV